MIDAKMFEKFINNSMAIAVNFSILKEYNAVTKIYDPRFEIINGVIIINNNSTENDVNEVRVDVNSFIFNKFNSNENKLVFNSKLNYANSLSVQRIDEE